MRETYRGPGFDYSYYEAKGAPREGFPAARSGPHTRRRCAPTVQYARMSLREIGAMKLTSESACREDNSRIQTVYLRSVRIHYAEAKDGPKTARPCTRWTTSPTTGAASDLCAANPISQWWR